MASNVRIEYNCNDRLGYSCFTVPSWNIAVDASTSSGNVNVLEISDGQKSHFLSTISSSTLVNRENNYHLETLKINGNFARCLNLKDGQEVRVSCQCQRVTTVSCAWVSCSSSDDWEILEPNAEALVNGLLNQLRVVYPGLKLPFWITKTMAVTLTIDKVEPDCKFGLLDNTSEIIIPALNQPSIPTLNPAHSKLCLRLHPIVIEASFHPTFSLIPSKKLLFSNTYHAFIHKCSIETMLDEPVSMNGGKNYFYAKLIGSNGLSQQKLQDNEMKRSQLVVKVFILEALGQTLHEFIESNFPVTNPPCLFIHQELISAHSSHNHNFEGSFKLKSHVLLEEVYQNDFETSHPEIQFTNSVPKPTANDYQFQFGGYHNLIKDGLDFLKASLSLGQVQHEFVGPEHGNLLITGREGSGKTALANRLIQELEGFPYFIHSEYFSCTRLRGKKPESLEKELFSIFERALQFQPAIVIMDDFDVLCPNFVSEQQQSAAEEFQHFRTSETVLKCILNYKSQQISFILTAIGSETINSYWRTRSGFHFCQLELSISPPDFKDRLDIFQKCLSRYQMLPENEGQTTTAQLHINSTCGENDLTKSRAQLNSSKIKSSSQSWKGNATEEKEGRTTHCYKLSPTMKKALETLHDEYTTAQFISNLAQKWTLCLFRKGSKDYDAEDDKEFQNVIENEIKRAGNLNETKPPSRISWDKIGGLVEVKNELTKILQWPIKYANLFESTPVKLPAGFLFYGYPGTGKTLLGLSLPSVIKTKFIHIKGPELLSKYIGASEQAVKDTFRRAKESKPCLLFFDEFDSLVPRRGHDSTGVTDRVVNQFLAEMDGIDGGLGAGVYLVASTSRPDLIDPAILRPGRLDKHLFFPLPNQEERIEIVKRQSEQMNLSQWNTNDWNEIGHATEGFTGADLQSLLFSAQLISIHEFLAELNVNVEAFHSHSLRQLSEGSINKTAAVSRSDVSITMQHMRKSLSSFKPSLSGKEFDKFHNIFQNFSLSRNGNQKSTTRSINALQQRATLA